MNKVKIAHKFRSLLSYVSPRLNTEVSYRVKFGKRLNLSCPKTFNEKLLWLKLYYYKDNDLVKQCADKLKVRDYIKEKGLSCLLNELLFVYEEPEQIKFEELPSSFALKLNVGSGCNLIVRSKSHINVDEVKSTVGKWLGKNPWAGYSEIQYRDVKPYILVEKFIGDPLSDKLPFDYKFYCMNGVCQYILVCLDRGIDTGRAHHAVKYFFLNRSWNVMPYTPEALQYKDICIPKPERIDDAIRYAESLSKDFPFVRVDFYMEGNKIIFGELTFTPAGAMDTELCMIPPGEDKSVDEIFADKLRLEKV